MYWYAECGFFKSLQGSWVIFHMIQQFLFIWKKGVDAFALGRAKGGASCEPDDLFSEHQAVSSIAHTHHPPCVTTHFL